MSERTRRTLERAGVKPLSSAPIAFVRREDIVPAIPGLLGTACLCFLSPTTVPVAGDWLPDSDIAATAYVKGANWQVWRDAALAMPGSSAAEIIELTANGYEYVQFKGRTLYNHLAGFSVAFLGHAPPQRVLVDILGYSKGRTKLGLFFANFETVSQEEPFNSWWQTLDDACLAHLRNTGIEQTGVGATAGCFFADQYQTTLSPAQAACGLQGGSGTAAPHTWVCDMGASGIATYVADWMEALRSMVVSRYGFGVLSYIMVDNVLGTPFWGAASNPDPAITQAIYRAAWKTFWAQAPAFKEATGVEIVGNCGIAQPAYTQSEVPGRYGEHFFHLGGNVANTSSETIAVLESQIAAAYGETLVMPHAQIKSSGATYTGRGYGSSHVDAWSGTPGGPTLPGYGNWTMIRDIVYHRSMQRNFFPVAGRTRSDFPLFHQPVFEDPRAR